MSEKKNAPIVNYCYSHSKVSTWWNPQYDPWGIHWSSRDTSPSQAYYIQAANTDMKNENDDTPYDSGDDFTDIWIRIRISGAEAGALVQGLKVQVPFSKGGGGAGLPATLYGFIATNQTKYYGVEYTKASQPRALNELLEETEPGPGERIVTWAQTTISKEENPYWDSGPVTLEFPDFFMPQNEEIDINLKADTLRSLYASKTVWKATYEEFHNRCKIIYSPEDKILLPADNTPVEPSFTAVEVQESFNSNHLLKTDTTFNADYRYLLVGWWQEGEDETSIKYYFDENPTIKCDKATITLYPIYGKIVKKDDAIIKQLHTVYYDYYPNIPDPSTRDVVGINVVGVNNNTPAYGRKFSIEAKAGYAIDSTSVPADYGLLGVDTNSLTIKVYENYGLLPNNDNDSSQCQAWYYNDKDKTLDLNGNKTVTVIHKWPTDDNNDIAIPDITTSTSLVGLINLYNPMKELLDNNTYSWSDIFGGSLGTSKFSNAKAEPIKDYIFMYVTSMSGSNVENLTAYEKENLQNTIKSQNNIKIITTKGVIKDIDNSRLSIYVYNIGNNPSITWKIYDDTKIYINGKPDTGITYNSQGYFNISDALTSLQLGFPLHLTLHKGGHYTQFYITKNTDFKLKIDGLKLYTVDSSLNELNGGGNLYIKTGDSNQWLHLRNNP